MNEKKWEDLAALLNDVIDMDGSHEEKKRAFRREMDEVNGEGWMAFCEIACWFTEEELGG